MSLTQSCPCWTQLVWALLTFAPIMLSDCILLTRNYMYVPSLLLGLSLQEVLGGPQDQLDFVCVYVCRCVSVRVYVRTCVYKVVLSV